MKKILGIAGLGGLLVLGSLNPLFAATMLGTAPGNGGDGNPATFHFDHQNQDFQMTQPDGTALAHTDVIIVYGIAIKIFENEKDYLLENNLDPMGADLSGSNWTNSDYPSLGKVAIDPATGRFKFAKTWEGTRQVGLDNGKAVKQIRVVLNDSHSGFCSYYQSDNLRNRAVVHQYIRGSGWQIGDLVDADTGNSAYQPELALSQAGMLLCAFNQEDDSNSRIWVNQFNPEVGWLGANTINPAGSNAWLPRLAVTDVGDALCCWRQQPVSDDYAYASFYNHGLGWSGAAIVSDGSRDINDVVVAMKNTSTAFCAIKQDHDIQSTEVVYINRYILYGGGWQGASLLSPALANAGYPKLAASVSGHAVCVYSYAGDGRLKAHVFDPQSETWGSAENIDATGSNPFSGIDVAMDDSGRVICAFVQSDGAVNNVYANRYVPGSGWEGAVKIDMGLNLGVSDIALDVNGVGRAVCVFKEYNGVNSLIYANFYLTNQGWEGAKSIDTPDGIPDEPDVAINSSGAVICAFKKRLGVSTYSIAHANRYASEIPGGLLLTNYYAADITPVPNIPSGNSLLITGKKIEPLKGEKSFIRYDVAAGGRVTIKLYNLQGELVKVLTDMYHDPGTYNLQWGAENEQSVMVSSGVYVLHFKMKGINQTEKIVVIK